MRLGAKAALGLLLILTTILGLSATRLTLSAQEQMLGDFRNYAIHVTNVAEAGLDNAMVSRDPSETNSVLQAVHGQEQIADVLILDPSGEVKYATDADMVGRVFTLADPACSICHDAGNQNTRQTVILPDAGSGRILRVATVLKNRTQCQPCHQSPTLGLLISDLSSGRY